MRSQVKDAQPSFETVALPVALRKKMGVTAMKIFAQMCWWARRSPDKLIHYSMSLPVAAAVIGMPKVEHIEPNVAVAKAFKPLPAARNEEDVRRPFGEEQSRPGYLLPRSPGRVNRAVRNRNI